MNFAYSSPLKHTKQIVDLLPTDWAEYYKEDFFMRLTKVIL